MIQAQYRERGSRSKRILDHLLQAPHRMRENVYQLMKIRVLLLAGASLALWALDFAPAQNKPDSGSSQIVGLENKWNAAYERGDVAAMDSLLADDFIITVEDGSTFSKPDTLRTTGTLRCTWRFRICRILRFECTARQLWSLVRITKKEQRRAKLTNTTTGLPMCGSRTAGGNLSYRTTVFQHANNYEEGPRIRMTVSRVFFPEQPPPCRSASASSPDCRGPDRSVWIVSYSEADPLPRTES